MMISIHFEEERIYYLSTSGQGIIVYLIFTSLRMLMIFITLWLTSCLQANLAPKGKFDSVVWQMYTFNMSMPQPEA